MFSIFQKGNPETNVATVAFAAAKGMFYGGLLFGAEAYFLHESTPHWLLALPVLLVGGAVVGAVMEWRSP